MVPDFQTLALPFLRILSDGQEHSLRELISKLSDEFNLTEAERAELLPSGGQPVIDNRVNWVRTYLKKSGLIENPRRGILKISEDGKKLLATKPSRIDVKYLSTLPAYQEWIRSFSEKEDGEEAIVEKAEIESGKTPEELLEYSFLSIKEQLASEVLEKVKSCPPAFFEFLVVDLLIRMGYGGSRKEAGQVMGRSGDGGIDGMIKEDKLGLDACADEIDHLTPI